jgi:cytochrome c-type biogenesis protein CcmH/NrfG
MQGRPENLTARALLARIRFASGDTADADKLVSEVLKDNPRDSTALQLRAQMALAREMQDRP